MSIVGTGSSRQPPPPDELQAMRSFMATVAHELRNFLGPVSCAVALLSRDGSPATMQARLVIDRQICQMKRMLEDLLDAARGEQGRISLRHEAVDLREVVAEALEVADPVLRERAHEVETVVDGVAAPIVPGDRCRLVQVVSNLLVNAAKFTPPRGRIRILIEAGPHHVATRVQDTGIGIEANALPRIFDLYERAGRAADDHGGLGLGLAIARHLVEAHGGTLQAFSAGAGKGSEFVMRLPRESPQADIARRMPA
jgi:signal transduction histidine kinase